MKNAMHMSATDRAQAQRGRSATHSDPFAALSQACFMTVGGGGCVVGAGLPYLVPGVPMEFRIGVAVVGVILGAASMAFTALIKEAKPGGRGISAAILMGLVLMGLGWLLALGAV